MPNGTKRIMTQHELDNKTTRFAEWLIGELMNAQLLESDKTKPSNKAKTKNKPVPTATTEKEPTTQNRANGAPTRA